jgi:hypothetical protein
MGLFFNLFVETGNDEKGNEKLREYFLSIGKLETPFGVYEMKTGNVENNIGITVSVNETGHTGLGSLGERKIATQVGHGFYELLKGAPEFRYAMVGVEAGEWVDGQDILDQNFDGYLPSHGLVINNELNIIKDEKLVPFKDGYSWTPYEGENSK